MLIDSHAHITSDELFPHVDEVLRRAKESGIETVVNICTDKVTLERGIKLARRSPMVVNVGATTPHDVGKEGEEMFPLFAAAAREGKLVGVGESGLDYFYDHSDRECQKKFLVRYFELALETDLPMVIHCRDAFADLFSLADAHYKKPLLLHCFTGSVAEAEEALSRGYTLSMSGIVTFKRSNELREVAKCAPLESLVVETDSPYLAPLSKRGRQNEPSFMVETAQLIAEVKGISFEEVARVTRENTKKLFRL